MTKKKQILTILLSIFASIILVTMIVSASTTVGNNVDIGGTIFSVGDLMIAGKATTTAASGNFATEGSVTIGSGTAISKHLSTSTVIDFPAIAATSCATSVASVGLIGVAAGDMVVAGPTATGSLIESFPLVWSAYASSADDYVSLTVCNIGNSGSVDLGDQTWRFDVWKH